MVECCKVETKVIVFFNHRSLLSLLMPIIILMFLLVKRLETDTDIKTLKRKNITNVSK
jgi:hypothetical protein